MILLDTSALYALADVDDRWHIAAIATLARLRKSGETFLVHSWITCEASSLIDARLGRAAAGTFLSQIAVLESETVGPELQAAALEELAKASSGASPVDCVSFAVMRRRKVATAFAFDPHFRAAGFRTIGG